MPAESEWLVVFVYCLIVVAMPGLPILWLWALWSVAKRKKWSARQTFAVWCLVLIPLIETLLLWPFFGIPAAHPPDLEHKTAEPAAIKD